MSLLSDIQGTPERVWSLLRLMSAVGGSLSVSEIDAWMNPNFRSGGGMSRETLSPSAVPPSVTQTIGCAVSLGLIEMVQKGQYKLSVELPQSLDGFADLVHGVLAAQADDEPNSVMLEAYAAAVALIEKHGGTSWANRTRTDLAGEIDHALRAVDERDGDRRFNSTKYASWARWMIFLGLGREVPMPGGRDTFYPYPAERLDRELTLLTDKLPPEQEHDFDAVLIHLSRRMPYLDGGRWLMATAERLGAGLRPRTVTLVLSGALRDLHDDGRLFLATLGDAADAFALGRDPTHPQRSVKTLTIRLPETVHA
jgi:hypothetical protein